MSENAATSSHAAAAIMEDSTSASWKDLLTCPICKDYFRNPFTLACGHTFCCNCISRVMREVRESNPNIPRCRLSFRCFTCRRSTLVRTVEQFSSRNIALSLIVGDWENGVKELSRRPRRDFTTQTIPPQVDDGSSEDEESKPTSSKRLKATAGVTPSNDMLSNSPPISITELPQFSAPTNSSPPPPPPNHPTPPSAAAVRPPTQAQRRSPRNRG